MIAAISFSLSIMFVCWLLFWVIPMFFLDMYFAIRITISYLTDKNYRQKWTKNHNGEKIFIWY